MDIQDSNFLQAVSLAYRRQGDKLYFLSEQNIASYHPEFQSGINRIKSFFKRNPKWYEFMRVVFSPGFSCVRKLSSQNAIRQVFGPSGVERRLIVNIGSGTKKIGRGVLNLDIYPFRNVDIVADIRELPFKDGSLDMVICESVLEHVNEPELVIREINRVVKKGGYLYVSVPFLYPFHASPDDYHRWSRSGLKQDFSDFGEVEFGLRAGPMAALQGVLMHIFAIPFSLGLKSFYIFWSQVFMVVFSPLKILDVFFSFSAKAHEAAADIYFLGRKK